MRDSDDGSGGTDLYPKSVFWVGIPFLFIVLITTVLLFGFINLRDGYISFQRASFFHAIEMADKYCAISQKEFDEEKKDFKLRKHVMKEREISPQELGHNVF